MISLLDKIVIYKNYITINKKPIKTTIFEWLNSPLEQDRIAGLLSHKYVIVYLDQELSSHYKAILTILNRHKKCVKKIRLSNNQVLYKHKSTLRVSLLPIFLSVMLCLSGGITFYKSQLDSIATHLNEFLKQYKKIERQLKHKDSSVTQPLYDLLNDMVTKQCVVELITLITPGQIKIRYFSLTTPYVFSENFKVLRYQKKTLLNNQGGYYEVAITYE